MIKIVSKRYYDHIITRMANMCEELERKERYIAHLENKEAIHVGDKVERPMYFVSRWFNRATCEYRIGDELKHLSCDVDLLRKVKQ